MAELARVSHDEVRIPRRRETRVVTGPRFLSRNRAEHARKLRMASWLKRRRRRHGIPEAMVRGNVFGVPTVEWWWSS